MTAPGAPAVSPRFALSWSADVNLAAEGMVNILAGGYHLWHVLDNAAGVDVNVPYRAFEKFRDF